MEPSIQKRLAELNREFYDTHGDDFAVTRPRLAPGVKRVVGRIPVGSRVLEVGCGDGKVGRRLAERGVHYLGLDSSVAMLARAQSLTENWRLENPQFSNSLLSFAYSDLLSADRLTGQTFHWILAFAIFHHLPGYEARRRVIQTLAAQLEPGGTLVMSNWQLTRSERLRQRIAPWSAIGLSEADMEPNDFLLTWKRGGRRGLRYVHVLAEAEARQLAVAAGLSVVEVFSADGASDDLAEYVVMRKS
ncbi:MAG: class I SAM-dependent methyltransferase [Anaerolineales bacterium]